MVTPMIIPDGIIGITIDHDRRGCHHQGDVRATKMPTQSPLLSWGKAPWCIVSRIPWKRTTVGAVLILPPKARKEWVMWARYGYGTRHQTNDINITSWSKRTKKTSVEFDFRSCHWSIVLHNWVWFGVFLTPTLQKSWLIFFDLQTSEWHQGSTTLLKEKRVLEVFIVQIWSSRQVHAWFGKHDWVVRMFHFKNTLSPRISCIEYIQSLCLTNNQAQRE